MGGIALRIDIETELKAINEGQCGLCRTGCTHEVNSACNDLAFHKNYWSMYYCKKCGHLSAISHFKDCPVCYKAVHYVA